MKESYGTKLCPQIVHISALFYQSLSIISASGRKLLNMKSSKSFVFKHLVHEQVQILLCPQNILELGKNPESL